jgi:ParB-like chromosome segregation protein Spo0J
LDLSIVYRRRDELKPDPANPRRHTKKQIRKIAESIKAFGFNVPILIDRNENVIAGHGRLLAARELGCGEVPTLCLDHLSQAEARAFMIADNRLTEIATWDDRLLAEQFKELSLLGLDFSLELTGFEMPEIDLRIASLDDPSERADDPVDVLPEAAAHPPLTRIGDLWVLGRHRVLCGNALDTAAFAALMGEKRAAMVFTDPLCNVPIDGHASGSGAIHHRTFPMASGEMDRSEFTGLLSQAFHNLAAFSIDGSLHYVCMDWRHPEELLAAGRDVYDDLKDLCVWVKDKGRAGSLYRSQHQLVFVFQQGRSRRGTLIGGFRRDRSNVWRCAAAEPFARRGNTRAASTTAKPVAMVADAILDGSARGEIVLDGFLGSGTTLIAAERTGRRCYGIELVPAYVDTTIRRWQTLTGGRVRHAGSGRSFDDLAREAEAGHAL